VLAGDVLGEMLKGIGMTPETYVKFKSEILGMSPECHCEERRIWLNEISRKLGVSRGRLMGVFKKFYERPM